MFMGDYMLYTSVENKKIKEIEKLNQKKYRDIEGLFLIEGEHLVKEAYKEGLLKTLIIKDNTNFNLDVETIIVSEGVLKYLSNLDTPQPVMGICKKLGPKELGNRILILDNIQDPGNLGTIIRSAVAFNVDTIILSKDTVDLYNSKVIRATQGMIFKVNIIVEDLITYIPKLKKENYKIISTSVVNGKNIKELVKNEKTAIIMGNEGNGVKKEISSLADDFIYIKMNNKCESLNVAVATSIILYELDK